MFGINSERQRQFYRQRITNLQQKARLAPQFQVYFNRCPGFGDEREDVPSFMQMLETTDSGIENFHRDRIRKGVNLPHIQSAEKLESFNRTDRSGNELVSHIGSGLQLNQSAEQA